MGCNCKGKNSKPELLPKGKVDLNLTGKLLKLPTAILMTVVIVILSPFLLVAIWWMAMTTIFGKDSNIVDLLLMKFKKKPKEDVDNERFDFNEEDYEIINVDVVK